MLHTDMVVVTLVASVALATVLAEVFNSFLEENGSQFINPEAQK